LLDSTGNENGGRLTPVSISVNPGLITRPWQAKLI